MNKQWIESKLEQLANQEEALKSIQAQMQTAIDEAIPEEVKAKVADIEAGYNDQIGIAQTNIASVAADIKAAVLAFGQSVKSERKNAVFSKGRVSWDTKGLDGFAVANPAILAFRKEGKPSISIREVK
jgi:hypothetical protein